jgi:hypothetical protein
MLKGGFTFQHLPIKEPKVWLQQRLLRLQRLLAGGTVLAPQYASSGNRCVKVTAKGAASNLNSYIKDCLRFVL